MRAPLQLTGVLAISILLSAESRAAIVSSTYSGTITTVSDPNGSLDGSITVGGTFSGSYSYDTNATNSNSPPFGSYYFIAAPPEDMSVSVSLGNYSYAVHSNDVFYYYPPIVSVWDNYDPGSGPTDLFEIFAGEFFPGAQTAGPAIPNLIYGMFYFNVTTSTNLSAVSGVGLPTSTPDLSDFSASTFNLYLNTPDGQIAISGELTELEDQVASVPEPSSLALLVCAGFAAFGYSARRRGRIE